MNWYHLRLLPILRFLPAAAILGLFNNPVFAEPIITEFLASNTLSSDTDGEASDWIEIHNPGDEPLSLEGYTLSDNLDLPAKWTFGSTTLEPSAYIVVFASGKDRQGGLDDLHTNFKLGAEGEALLLSAPDGTVLSSFEFPPQFPDVSYGVYNAENQFFDPPTRGEVNEEGFAEFVLPPAFSKQRGFCAEPFNLTLEADVEGASIHYLMGGKDPAEGTIFSPALVYSGPIEISQTTVIRAYVKHPDGRESRTTTQTYLFPEDIVNQPNDPAGFPTSWKSIQADYAMDPRITTAHADQMDDALRSLPSVSFSGDTSEIFGANGIYANPQSAGVIWERPISMEWIDPGGTLDFQINCGLRIQGGYFRDPSATQKHSFRVLFKKIYGQGKLNQPIFNEPGAAEEFDTLVFRAGANDGYSWNAAIDTEQFIRDEFGRRLLLDMGQPSSRGTFVHLYVNGLYWGLHNLAERPNEDFSASYLGGESEEWDSVNSGDVKSGSMEAWNAFTQQTRAVTSWEDYQRVQGLNPDGTRNPEYPIYFDATNYVDYMISNLWGGNWDWPNKNFWFGRKRTEDSTGFKFYTWDFENTMGNNRDRSPLQMEAPTNTTWVGEPYGHLIDTVWFQMDYADRVHRHFFNGGILTPDVLIERYQTLADRVELSILTESARWGDDHHSTPQTIDDWYRERDWILNTYLPQRSGIVLQQFRKNKLYPESAAPVLNQHGGRVDHGFMASFTEPATNIYFTLDGSDPFVINPNTGAIELSETSLPYEDAFLLTETTTVKARTYSRSIFGTVSWSALNEATFVIGSGDVVMSEVTYHPTAPTVQENESGFREGNQFEYLVLLNTGIHPVKLDGMHFTQGITFDFTSAASVELAPGATAILVSNSEAFTMRYGSHPIAGEFGGRLDNAGERITLVDASGAIVRTVEYGDAAPWPKAADGEGSALSLVAPTERPDHELAENWTATPPLGGSNPVEGTSLADWLASHELSDSETDPDGDGLISFLEYALGTDPKNSDASTDVISLEVEIREGIPVNRVTFQRRTSLQGVTLQLEGSEDLQTWDDASIWFTPDGDPLPDGELETRHLTRPLTDSEAPQLYLRLRGQLSAAE